ncbi:class I SAM-dependent methyltransferase [Nocardioides convexus]|uniref:class I SAM-dependent methyltransferase n=1 Tax=Nocardioides convexus TaxID=2712224 RepID=UPI0024186FDC|nr:class I SAM-dependent methyltransferase [Nocardioides convexus]
MTSTVWASRPVTASSTWARARAGTAFEMYRRGADVIAFDIDAEELEGVRDLFVAMKEAGEVPEGAEADVKQGDALALPFADGEFDRIVCSEVLEHIHDDVAAIREPDPRPASWRHPGRDRAPVAPRGRQLAPVGGLPQRRGWPHPDLHRPRAWSTR